MTFMIAKTHLISLLDRAASQAQRRALALIAVSDLARVAHQEQLDGTTSQSDTDTAPPAEITPSSLDVAPGPGPGDGGGGLASIADGID